MSRNEELIAEFDFERHVFGRGESRMVIGDLCDGRVVKGRAAEGALETGLTYRFYGQWTRHPKYGQQFAFSSFTQALPAGQRGTVAYLQRCRGIGRKRALKIWEKFNSESLTVLKDRPAEVAEAVGIKEEVAVEAAEFFRRIERIEGITIELTELLAGKGFPRRLVETVIGEWGAEGPGMIRDNPYVLMQFSGCGFVRCDQLYLELGKDSAAIERQARCAWYVLHKDSEGHTWQPIGVVYDAINQNVAGAEVDCVAAIAWGIENDLIVARDHGGQQWVAEAVRAAAEERLARGVRTAEVDYVA